MRFFPLLVALVSGTISKRGILFCRFFFRVVFVWWKVRHYMLCNHSLYLFACKCNLIASFSFLMFTFSNSLILFLSELINQYLGRVNTSCCCWSSFHTSLCKPCYDILLLRLRSLRRLSPWGYLGCAHNRRFRCLNFKEFHFQLQPVISW